ncbi:hypothetical protein Q5752_004045 [Cryptotrichosporon argae]
MPPFHARAPFEPVADIVTQLVADLETRDAVKVQIVDCCSGSGGSWAAIDRNINARDTLTRHPTKILLSDFHPDVRTCRAPPSFTAHRIFELQVPDLGSVITILALFPLSPLLTHFLRPTLRTLFPPYLIPLIPLVLVFDGLLSAYRPRSPAHLLHLADMAAVGIAVEAGEKDYAEWTFTSGRSRHTAPCGHMVWTIGRKHAG